jgi:SEC-C motif-containing protein
MPNLLPSQPCPCGRQAGKRALAYAQCCGRYLDHFESAPAPDAEFLMRSRYTAFVAERADYLLATWQAGHRPMSIEFDPGVKWLGLEVRSHRQLDAAHAEVEFVARQKSPGGPAVRLHERSRFAHEAGRWYYVDGNIT